MSAANIKQLIERLRQRSNPNHALTINPAAMWHRKASDCHAAANMLEQYLATKQEYSDFRQEVSDVVKAFNNGWANCRAVRQQDWEALLGFIIPAPTPDPLVEALAESDIEFGPDWGWQEQAKALRAALEARGLKIVEKNDD
jgi:hypothetical protein